MQWATSGGLTVSFNKEKGGREIHSTSALKAEVDGCQFLSNFFLSFIYNFTKGLMGLSPLLQVVVGMWNKIT